MQTAVRQKYRILLINVCLLRRVVEDYAVLYCGSAMFKIGRLLLIAMMSVHLFACVFFRVKKESATSLDDVELFYSSKGVDPNVRVLSFSTDEIPPIIPLRNSN
jgi:hypothetical protein